MAPVGDAGRVSQRRRIYVQNASCVVNYGLHWTGEAADENGGRGFKEHLTGMMTGVHVEVGPGYGRMMMSSTTTGRDPRA